VTGALIKIAGNISSKLYKSGEEEFEKKRSITKEVIVKYVATVDVRKH